MNVIMGQWLPKMRSTLCKWEDVLADWKRHFVKMCCIRKIESVCYNLIVRLNNAHQIIVMYR